MINAPLTVSGQLQVFGTLTVSGDLRANTIDWTGGGITAPKLIIANGGNLSGDLVLNAALTLQNGSVNFRNANFSASGTGSITLGAAASMRVTGDTVLGNSGGLINNGVISIDADNGDPDNGNASLTVNSSFSNNTTLTLTSSGSGGDARLTVIGGNFVNAGTLDVQAGSGGARTVEADGFELRSGRISGDGVLDVRAPFNWTGGLIASGAEVRLNQGGSIDGSKVEGLSVTLDGRLSNLAGNLRISAATITGTGNIINDATIVTGGGAVAFDVAIGGAGNTMVNTNTIFRGLVRQGNAVDVSSGVTATFQNGFDLGRLGVTGAVSVAGLASVVLLEVLPGGRIFNGGMNADNLTWTGGTIDNTVLLANGGNASGALDLGGSLQVNGGTLLFNGATLTGSGVLTNNSALGTTGAASSIDIAMGGGGNLDINAPVTFHQSLVGAGTVSANASVTFLLGMNGVASLDVNNGVTVTLGTSSSVVNLGMTGSGVLDVSGTMNVTNRVNLAGGTVNATALNVANGGVVSAPVTLNAPLNLNGGLLRLDPGAGFAGSGAITLTNAGFDVVGNLTIPNAVAFAGNVATTSVTGPGDLTLSGPLSWADSTNITGSGRFITNGSTSIFNAGSDGAGINRSWINNGTVDLTGTGYVDFFNGASTWTNAATGVINLKGSAANPITTISGSGHHFVNLGTINKAIGSAAGQAIGDAGLAVDNSGSINVNAGSLTVGGNGSNSGRFNATPGTTFNLGAAGSSGSFADGAVLSGGGNFNLDGGSSTLTGTAAGLQVQGLGTTVNLAGSTVNGAGNLSFATGTTFNWSGGSLAGSGILATGTGSTTNMSGGLKVLSDRTWNNRGVVNWSGGNTSLSTAASTINNQSGGVWNILTASPFDDLSGAGTFNNLAGAIINGNAPGGSNSIEPARVNHAGIFNLQNGDLDFDGGSTINFSGTLNLANGTRVLGYTPGSTLNFNPGTALNYVGIAGGSAQILVNSYTVNINVPLVLPAAVSYNQTGGATNISGSLATASFSQSGGVVGGGGDLNVNGSFTRGAGLAANTLTLGNISITQAAGNLAISGIAATGAITLSAPTGAITDANGAGIVNLMAPTVTLSAANGIDLDTASANLRLTNNGGAAIIRNNQALALGVIDTQGAFSLTNSGAIRQQGGATLTIDGAASFDTSAVASIGSVNIATGGSGTLSIVGGSRIAGNFDLATGGRAVDYGGTVDVGGTVNAPASATISNLRQAGSNTAATFDNTSTPGVSVITAGGTGGVFDLVSIYASATQGTVNINLLGLGLTPDTVRTAAAITLANSGNTIGGPLSIKTVDPDLRAGAPINYRVTQSAPIDFANRNVVFNGGGAGNVALTNAANSRLLSAVFNNTFDTTLVVADSTSIGASSTAGKLSVTAGTGLAVTGALSAGGDLTLNANAGKLALANNVRALAGLITINVPQGVLSIGNGASAVAVTGRDVMLTAQSIMVGDSSATTSSLVSATGTAAGTGTLDISTSGGDLRVLGGGGTDAFAALVSTRGTSATVTGGNLILRGGAGAGAYALIDPTLAGDLTLGVLDGSLLLQGGSGAGAAARLQNLVGNINTSVVPSYVRGTGNDADAVVLVGSGGMVRFAGNLQAPSVGDPIGNGVIDSGAYRLAPPPSPPANDFAGSSDKATQDVLANQPKPPTAEPKPKDEVVVEGDDGC